MVSVAENYYQQKEQLDDIQQICLSNLKQLYNYLVAVLAEVSNIEQVFNRVVAKINNIGHPTPGECSAILDLFQFFQDGDETISHTQKIVRLYITKIGDLSAPKNRTYDTPIIINRLTDYTFICVGHISD